MTRSKSANLLHMACAQYAERVKGDLNVIVGIVGGPGSGKSSLSQVMAEILRDEFGFKFSVDNIFFEPADFLDAISRRKSVVILDEAGVAINSRLFMTELNKAISFATQTARFKNNVLIFIAPHIRFIDKAVRTLIMHIWRARATKENGTWIREAKPYIVYTNFVSEKMDIRPARYNLNGEFFEYPWIRFPRPSEELWQEYLKRKEKWWEKAKKEWKDAITTEFKDKFEALKDEYKRIILENKKYFEGRNGISATKLLYFPWEQFGLPKLSRKHAYTLQFEIQQELQGSEPYK